jgi:hypothetical protein
VRADDSIEQPGLWSNLKAKLLRAHFFIAILTGDVNPNVMIEIGRMEALEQPLLIVRDRDAPPLPADLQGLLYEELDGTGAELEGRVAEALGRQHALQALRSHDRFLSETVLMKNAGLNEDASKEISRRYPTWREFLAADAAAVASQARIPRSIVEAVQRILSTLLNPET